jgi:hypothetical protein
MTNPPYSLKNTVLKLILNHSENQMKRFLAVIAFTFIASLILAQSDQVNAETYDTVPADKDKPNDYTPGTYDFTPADADKKNDYTPGDKEKPFDYKPGDSDKPYNYEPGSSNK